MLSSSSLFLPLILLSAVSGLRILSLVPSPSVSHHIFNRVLNLELARRGHDVTVLSSDPEKFPPKGSKYRHFVAEGGYESVKDLEFEGDFDGLYACNKLFFNWADPVSRWNSQTQAAKDVLRLAQNETFDLIIYETALQDWTLGYVEAFNFPPLIGISAFGYSPWINLHSGNSEHPAYLSNMAAKYESPRNFWEKLETHLYEHLIKIYYRMFHLPRQEAYARKLFGEDKVKSLEDIARNTSLFLMNTNLARDLARPASPEFISIGGIHVTKAKALPQDLQVWMDNAKEKGVILFSLGSNVRSDQLPKQILEMLIETFQKTKENILWKFETDISGLPSNVKIAKWLPQADILAHPNTRLFITHGGGMSTNEALYHGVPLIVLPFFGDQLNNAEKLTKRGMALQHKLYSLTSDQLTKAIRRAIDDPSFKQRAKELQAIYTDGPESPLDRAVFWIEYVARHKGAKHLRLGARDLAWYELAMLDLTSLYILALVLFILFTKSIIRRIFPSAKTKIKKH